MFACLSVDLHVTNLGISLFDDALVHNLCPPPRALSVFAYVCRVCAYAVRACLPACLCLRALLLACLGACEQKLVADPTVLFRTECFPGLGWMMTKQLWDRELRQKWPLGYWDDWLREPEQRRDRSCIAPEVGRAFGHLRMHVRVWACGRAGMRACLRARQQAFQRLIGYLCHAYVFALRWYCRWSCFCI